MKDLYIVDKKAKNSLKFNQVNLIKNLLIKNNINRTL